MKQSTKFVIDVKKNYEDSKNEKLVEQIYNEVFYQMLHVIGIRLGIEFELNLIDNKESDEK